MRCGQRCLWSVAGMMLILGGTKAADQIPMPVPDFQLTALDGTTMNAKQLPMTGRWLLIYTKANCRSCDTLLGLINKDEQPDLPLKVVIVVSDATPEKVSDLKARFPDLAEAAWYADPSKTGAAQLGLQGTPTVFGVSEDRIEWCVLGVLEGDTLKMKSILASWYGENP